MTDELWVNQEELDALEAIDWSDPFIAAKWGDRLVKDLQDAREELRYALRQIQRNPGLHDIQQYDTGVKMCERLNEKYGWNDD